MHRTRKRCPGCRRSRIQRQPANASNPICFPACSRGLSRVSLRPEPIDDRSTRLLEEESTGVLEAQSRPRRGSAPPSARGGGRALADTIALQAQSRSPTRAGISRNQLTPDPQISRNGVEDGVMRGWIVCVGVACAGVAVAGPRGDVRETYELAAQLDDDGEYEQALGLVEQGLAIAPKDLELLGLKGTVLLKLRDYTRALAAYRAYLDAGVTGANRREAQKIVNSLGAVQSTFLQITLA